ncbi:MAG: hypothetical protein ACYCVN_02855 [Acidimicrobiales bacterium]
MNGRGGDALPELDEADRRQASLPPVARLATATLASIVVGGIYMASSYGRTVTLVPPLVLVAVAAAVLAVNVTLLARVNEFAWDSFFQVTGWALLAYCAIAGILEFVFIYDRTPANQLWLLTAMLVLFAVDIPLLLGFSVARWQPIHRADDSATMPTAQSG